MVMMMLLVGFYLFQAGLVCLVYLVGLACLPCLACQVEPTGPWVVHEPASTNLHANHPLPLYPTPYPSTCLFHDGVFRGYGDCDDACERMEYQWADHLVGLSLLPEPSPRNLLNRLASMMTPLRLRTG